MPHSLLVSYLGDNRPGLITQFLTHIDDLGGEIGDITFASLGRRAEMTFICKTPEEIDSEALKTDLQSLKAVSKAEITVQPYIADSERGPSHRITHRVILNGDDKPGLIHQFVATFDQYGAIIVRMNAESIQSAHRNQCIIRFAVSMRDETGPGMSLGGGQDSRGNEADFPLRNRLSIARPGKGKR